MDFYPGFGMLDNRLMEKSQIALDKINFSFYQLMPV